MNDLDGQAATQFGGSTVQPKRGVRSWKWYLQFWRDPIACMSTVHQQFGPLFALAEPKWLHHPERLHVLALGPRYNRLVLGQPEKYHAGGFTARGRRDSALRRLRRGLAGANGERYRRQRHTILPPFQRAAVGGYVPEMARIIDQCLDGWPQDRPVDMHRLTRQLSLNLSSQFLFGSDDIERSARLSAALENFLARAAAHGAALVPVNLPGLPYRSMLKFAEDLERLIIETIELKRRPGSSGRDVLSIMVQASTGDQAAFIESELPGHTVFMFGASFETAADAMGWTLFLLAQHPKVALSLIDELDGAYLSDPPTLDELDRLPLLNAAIDEAMRLLPPVPYTIRTVTSAADFDGLPLKRGDRIVISHYMTHHMPELYPMPNRFIPERWESLKPDPYTYLPFSAGPRLCVGYHFAMAEIRLALLKIMKRYRLTVVPGSRIDRTVRVTLNPTFGLPMLVCSQDRAFKTSAVTGHIHEMVELPAPGS
jgi:cytochrome P450